MEVQILSAAPKESKGFATTAVANLFCYLRGLQTDCKHESNLVWDKFLRM
ncbi:MAG: hypothetical protein H0Z39_03380 [Peptococcaceae bacterium]|nr:hypothetical protein [Peptococcaceae bacterium]